MNPNGPFPFLCNYRTFFFNLEKKKNPLGIGKLLLQNNINNEFGTLNYLKITYCNTYNIHNWYRSDKVLKTNLLKLFNSECFSYSRYMF